MSARAGAAGLGLRAILLAALLGGCRDSLVAPPDSASATLTPIGGSVTITGVPAGRLAVGTVVQLGATLRSSTGTPVTGTVKWRSADSTVARVSAAGVITAVNPGQAPIIAANGRAADTAWINVIPPPASLTISSSFGAMYLGQHAVLKATARDDWGYEITGLYVTWASSDPQKLSVDTAGKAAAVAVGPVTVTVTAGARSTSVPFPVVARPVSEWSQAGTWATFQGNARHTGLVAATADPVSFKLLWEKASPPKAP